MDGALGFSSVPGKAIPGQIQPGFPGATTVLIGGALGTVAVAAPAGTVVAGANLAGPVGAVTAAPHAGTVLVTVAGPVVNVAVAPFAGTVSAGATLAGPAANVSVAAGAGVVVVTSNIAVVQQVTGGTTGEYGLSSVAFTNTAGNGLVAFIGWDVHNNYTQAPVPAVYVNDSAGNYWYPLATSAAGGYGSRCAIWFCPNARAVKWVSVALTGFASALSYNIVEFSGLPNFADIDLSATQFINGGAGAPTVLTKQASTTWTAPAGVTSVEVECWGGGGGGTPGVWINNQPPNGNTGGGGGGGEYAREPAVAVTAGHTYTVTVGGGGAAGGGSGIAGANGGSSSFAGDAVTVTAHGGHGAPGVGTTAGHYAGGAAGSGSTNSVHYPGGAGGAGTNDTTNDETGGGGGSSAGNAAAGRAGSDGQVQVSGLIGGQGGVAPTGGANGGSSSGQNPAQGGGTPGGGGAGGGVWQISSGLSEILAAGGGGGGQVQLTYTPAAPPASLTVSGPLTANDVLFTMLAAGDGTETLSSGPAGFTALNTAAAGGASDGMTIFPYYLASSAGATSSTAAYTVSVGTALSAALTGLNLSPPIPALVNPRFPNMKVEAAFGYLPGDITQPPPVWTDITTRALTPAGGVWVKATYGAAYELAQQEAGELAIALNNQDGAFTPGNAGSPYYPNVVLGTPIRVSAFWNGRWFPVAYGYVERWPQDWPHLPQWGVSVLVATDAVAVLSGTTLPSAVEGEILIDAPYAYFPCSEQYATTTQSLNPVMNATAAGGQVCANAARANQRPAVYVNGVNTVNVQTGQALNLLGDNTTAMGGQITFPLTGVGNSGPAVVYNDPAMPGTDNANGWSAEFWAVISDVTHDQVIFQGFGVPTAFSPLVALYIWINTSGVLTVNFADGTSVSGPTITASAAAQHFAFTISAPSASPILDIYVNGVQTSGFSVTAAQLTGLTAASLGAAFYAFASVPAPDSFIGGHLALYGYQLPSARIASHYQAGATGWTGVPASERFAQILSYGRLGLPRAGTSGADGITMGPAYDLGNATASEAVRTATDSDQGFMASMPTGAVEYVNRWWTFNLTPAFTLGDDAAEPLNANPDLGNGLTGWSPVNGVLTLSNAQPFLLANSILLTPNSSVTHADITGSEVPISTGGTYTAQVWVNIPTGWANVTLGFNWNNSSHVFVSQTTQSFSVAPGSWTFLTATLTAPSSGVAFGVIVLSLANSPSPTNILYAQELYMTAGNEIPFEPGEGFDYDNTYLYNVVQATQVVGPNTGVTATTQDFTSQNEYFTRSALQSRTQGSSLLDAFDKANWQTGKYAQPGVRVRAVAVDAASKPTAAFNAVLTIRVGDVVSVARRPVGGAVISGTYIVTKITHTIGPLQWKTEYEMSPYTLESSVLELDTAGLNVLGGGNLA